MIAIIIKTYCRARQVKTCIDSIFSFVDHPFRIYLADDSPKHEHPSSLYEKLIDEGHYVRFFDSKVSVTHARNYLVEQLQDEPYVLRIDDDFIFSHETSLSAMVDVLRVSDVIGAVSSVERQLGDGKGVRDGELSDKQGFFVREGRALHKLCMPVNAVSWMTTDRGTSYSLFDFTRNCLLIKREVFEKVRWREELFIQGEHSAFMLDLKRAGYFLAQTPDSIHCHDERSAKEASYLDVRKSQEGLAAMQAFYAKEYGIDEIKTFSLGKVLETQNPSYSRMLRMFASRAVKDVRRLFK